MYLCHLSKCPLNSPKFSRVLYSVYMTQNETAIFFRALRNLEALKSDANPLYIEGYDFVMDDVKFAILSGDIESMYDLDEFVNHLDAFAEDNEPGDYANGYQDAVNVCLEAVSKLLETAAAA